METVPYIGETFALASALVWALAVICFKKSGETTHPLALNLFKDVLSLILFVPTLYFFGETLFIPASPGEYAVLLVSGVLGIAIGDTLFLKCLNVLGAGLTAIVTFLYTPFTIGLSILFLRDVLTFYQVIGAALIAFAVLVASLKPGTTGLTKKALLYGLGIGLLAIVSSAAGLVMIKNLLDRSPLIWVVEIRLVGGVIALLAFLPFMRNRRAVISSMFSKQGFKYTLLGSLSGAYLGMVFWLAGMKYSLVSIATALSQTSNLMVFAFAALLLKEPITSRRLAGILMAVAGALLITFL
ncbi:MAG: DMT family transporter [Candidatus Coatesbacteria bacterium]|nr:MAG: DMT family transporter [Candidatus Coatesbacteria bacterium]